MTYIKALMLIMKAFPDKKIVYFKHKDGEYWFNIGAKNPVDTPRDGTFYILDEKTGSIKRYHKDMGTGEITLAE